MSPSNSSASGFSGHGGLNYIEHQVSKLDTLAGIAIKYGVEVADIKRLNGLTTDLQMFALKKLRISQPGRHPPSLSLSDASASTGGGSVKNASPAMSTLQKYYGLKSCASEGVEMSVYITGKSDGIDNGLFPKTFVLSSPAPNILMPWNVASTLLPQTGLVAEHEEPGEGESEKSDEKLVRRRQKTEVDSRVGTPERLLKGENNGGSCFLSASNGKGLAMRPKSGSRSTLSTDSESGWICSIPVGMGDAIITDSMPKVHKALSTSNLRDQDGNNSASGQQTSKRSLKPDLQALSSVGITKPLFDGLSNPITGRRNKAALD